MNRMLLVALVATTIACVYAHYYKQGPSDYKFSYGVKDTGDNYEHHEIIDGHTVKGAYSLKEADGTTRLVEYEAGPYTGFNAIVKRIGHAHHPLHYNNNEYL